LAGFNPHRGNAARLRANESVQARVNELQTKMAERAIEKTAISKQWALDRLVENAERALQARRAMDDDGEETGEFKYQGNVANWALELVGKELGMFIDRKEVGKPGDFAGMSDDELNDYIARGKASLGGSDRGNGSPPVTKGLRKPH
jgi:phage terminase small subunit